MNQLLALISGVYVVVAAVVFCLPDWWQFGHLVAVAATVLVFPQGCRRLWQLWPYFALSVLLVVPSMYAQYLAWAILVAYVAAGIWIARERMQPPEPVYLCYLQSVTYPERCMVEVTSDVQALYKDRQWKHVMTVLSEDPEADQQRITDAFGTSFDDGTYLANPEDVLALLAGGKNKRKASDDAASIVSSDGSSANSFKRQKLTIEDSKAIDENRKLRLEIVDLKLKRAREIESDTVLAPARKRALMQECMNI